MLATQSLNFSPVGFALALMTLFGGGEVGGRWGALITDVARTSTSDISLLPIVFFPDHKQRFQTTLGENNGINTAPNDPDVDFGRRVGRHQGSTQPRLAPHQTPRLFPFLVGHQVERVRQGRFRGDGYCQVDIFGWYGPGSEAGGTLCELFCRFRLPVGWSLMIVRQTINHYITYSVISSQPALSYTSVLSTIRLYPVTSGEAEGSTFIEWTGNFSSDADAGEF